MPPKVRLRRPLRSADIWDGHYQVAIQYPDAGVNAGTGLAAIGRGVVIECKDFRDILVRYDRPHTFFFIDLPYWQIKEYRYNVEERDFESFHLKIHTFERTH